MNSEYSPDLLNLMSDDGVEKEFEILDIIENDDKCYYILSPHYEDRADALNRAFEYYIFKAFEQNGEQQFVELDDEAEIDKILSAFEERFNDMLFGNE